MGIRESLEKGIGEKELRLQDLDLEKIDEQNEQVGFDEERDISERDWERIHEVINKFRTDKKWESFLQDLSCVILGSSKKDEFKIDFSQLELEEIEAYLNLEKEIDRDGYLSMLVILKLALPELEVLSIFLQDLDNDDLEFIKKKAGDYMEDDELSSLVSLLIKMKCLFPKEYEAFIASNNIFDLCEKEVREALLRKDYFVVEDLLSELMFVSDDKEIPVDLFVDKGFWKWRNKRFVESKQALFKEARSNYGFFNDLLVNKIISAKKILMTENGLEFVPREREYFKKTEIKKRPERRQF